MTDDRRRSPRSYSTAARIREALRRFELETERLCRRNGLSSDQYTLLLMIQGARGGPGATVGQLAERLELAHNGVAERVARAQAAGLVHRQPHPADRRSSVILLTAEGERRLAGAFADLGEESDLLIRFLGEVDRAERSGIAK